MNVSVKNLLPKKSRVYIISVNNPFDFVVIKFELKYIYLQIIYFLLKVNIESDRNEYEQIKGNMIEFYNNHVT